MMGKPAVTLRKRPSTKSADAFVDGMKSERQKVKTFGRPKGADKEQVTLYLSPDTAKDLRVNAAMTGNKMSDIAQLAITEYLSRQTT